MAANDVTLRFIADAKGATSEMDKLIAKAKEIKQSVEVVNITGAGIGAGIENGAAKSEAALSKITAEMTNMISVLNNVRNNTAINTIAQDSEKGAASVLELKGSLSDINKKLQELETSTIDEKFGLLDSIFLDADKALKVLSNDLKLS